MMKMLRYGQHSCNVPVPKTEYSTNSHEHFFPRCHTRPHIHTAVCLSLLRRCRLAAAGALRTFYHGALFAPAVMASTNVLAIALLAADYELYFYVNKRFPIVFIEYSIACQLQSHIGDQTIQSFYLHFLTLRCAALWSFGCFSRLHICT